MKRSPKTRGLDVRITEAERTLAERSRYVVDDDAAQRFLAALDAPSAEAERGLRRLTGKPSVLPEA